MKQKHTTHKIARKIVAIATASTVASALNACSGVMAHDIGEENILFMGSAEAVSRYFDGVNGLTVSAKMPADANDSPHYQLRRLQSAPKVQRAKSFRR